MDTKKLKKAQEIEREITAVQGKLERLNSPNPLTLRPASELANDEIVPQSVIERYKESLTQRLYDLKEEFIKL